MKGAVANARMKKSKVMKKSSKSKNSLTPSTQKKATRKPAKLICSVTRQELVITTNDSVMGLQEEMIRAELDSKGPPTPPPSPGRGGSIHDNTN